MDCKGFSSSDCQKLTDEMCKYRSRARTYGIMGEDELKKAYKVKRGGGGKKSKAKKNKGTD